MRANVVVDSSSAIQTQLSAVHDNNDVGLCANSEKKLYDRNYTPFGKLIYTSNLFKKDVD